MFKVSPHGPVPPLAVADTVRRYPPPYQAHVSQNWLGGVH